MPFAFFGGGGVCFAACKTGAQRQDFGTANRTLPAAISRSAVTTSRLSDAMSGCAPFKSCRVRIAAMITRSKRLGTFFKQSSMVILAIDRHCRPLYRRVQAKYSQLTQIRLPTDSRVGDQRKTPAYSKPSKQLRYQSNLGRRSAVASDSSLSAANRQYPPYFE